MPRFVPTGDMTNKTPYIPPGSIRISSVQMRQVERFYQPCIVGITTIGRSVVGYSPFLVGIDKIGRQHI